MGTSGFKPPSSYDDVLRNDIFDDWRKKMKDIIDQKDLSRDAYWYWIDKIKNATSSQETSKVTKGIKNIRESNIMKEIIESEKSTNEIVNDLTEQVKKFQGVAIDTEYWEKNFGLGTFEAAVDEYNIDMRKVQQAVDKINKEGMRLVGGSPEQELFSKGSVYVVRVDRNETKIPFNDQPKFNAHVAYYAAENGDPTRNLTEEA